MKILDLIDLHNNSINYNNYSIGVISDLHIGRENQYDKLEEALNHFAKNKCSYILCAGDILDEINENNIKWTYSPY